MIVSRAVLEKSDLTAVVASLLSNHRHVRVRSTCVILLCKVAGGNRSEFYFGNDRAFELMRSIAIMITAANTQGTGVKVIKRSDIQRFVDLQTELNDVIDARTAELEAVLAPAREDLSKIKFMISDPGAQYTASFNPILRQHARDYFGPSSVNFDLFVLATCEEMSSSWDDSSELSVLRRRSNLMKMIFKWLDRSYILALWTAAIPSDLFCLAYLCLPPMTFSILSAGIRRLFRIISIKVFLSARLWTNFKNKSNTRKELISTLCWFSTCCW